MEVIKTNLTKQIDNIIESLQNKLNMDFLKFKYLKMPMEIITL